MNTEVDSCLCFDSSALNNNKPLHIHGEKSYEYLFDTTCISCINTVLSDMQTFKMNHEKYRLESFINWPKSWIKPKELARNGFFYKGFSDVVECNFCGSNLWKWEVGDIVQDEHKRHFPFCRFHSGKVKTNIPLKEYTDKNNITSNKFKWMATKSYIKHIEK